LASSRALVVRTAWQPKRKEKNVELTKMNFQTGKVLSITTGFLLCENHVDGLYEILNFMTGENLFTHQLGRATKICAPAIIENYPSFDPEQNPELAFALRELQEMLKTETAKGQEMELLRGWLASQIYPVYGEYVTIETLPEWRRNSKDPIEELEEMVPKEKIIAAQTDSKPAINPN